MKNNLFTQKLTASSEGLLAERALLVNNAAEAAQADRVALYKKRKNTLLMELADLTDLGPDSKDSLKPTSSKFDAESWVENVHSLERAIELVEIDIKTAQRVYDKWFTDTETVTKEV